MLNFEEKTRPQNIFNNPRSSIKPGSAPDPNIPLTKSTYYYQNIEMYQFISADNFILTLPIFDNPKQINMRKNKDLFY